MQTPSSPLPALPSSSLRRREWLLLLFARAAGAVMLAGAGALARAPSREPARAGHGADERAPALLLANVLRPDIDVTRYLVSEKFDGVRAIWDGRRLRFRSGRDVPAPTWWLAKLPAVPLDGELWLARGKFDELSGLVRTGAAFDDEWRRVNYLVFELPEAPGGFAERYERIKAIVAASQWQPLRAIEQTRVSGRVDLKRRLDEIVKAGGEGVMLHLADAAYQTGRGDVLLKLKPLLDAEATVVAHVPGKGKHAGKLGALVVRTQDGVVFRLGTGFSDALRAAPPPVGSIVTFSYRDLTLGGTPRFASFLREVAEP